jgi:hypothetical protein
MVEFDDEPSMFESGRKHELDYSGTYFELSLGVKEQLFAGFPK